MVSKQSGMFIILSIAIATAISGTTAMSLAASVFAVADHRDHDEKKCKNNDDNNCNAKHKTQKINAKNEREIENYNKEHSKDNKNLNELTCVNDAQNLDDVFEELLVEEGVGDEVA
jgi:uncharacterized membrane protein YhiD involved in acid resistance